MAELTIREAQADDVGFLVATMRSAATAPAGGCVWDLLFDAQPDAVDRLLATVASSPEPHACHLSRFWVAEREREPVGALSGYDVDSEGDAAFGAALGAGGFEELGLDAAGLAGLADRGRTMDEVTPAPVAGAFGIENVAVSEAARGTGVVDALIEHALATARERDYSQAQIQSLLGNERAHAVWRRHGFSRLAAYSDERYRAIVGDPGMALFARSL